MDLLTRYLKAIYHGSDTYRLHPGLEKSDPELAEMVKQIEESFLPPARQSWPNQD